MAVTFPKAGPNDNGVHSFLPASLIAGTVNMVSGAVGHRVAYNAACLALQTERVCMIAVEDGDRVHYLAGDAREFAEFAMPVSTSLIAALPNSITHMGDGVYYHPVGEMMACLIVRERRIKTFVGSKEVARRFPKVEKVDNLPVHELWLDDPLAPGSPPWSGYAEQERETNRRLLHRTALLGLTISVVMAGVWICSVLWHGYNQAQLNDQQEKVRQSLTTAVGQLQAAPYKQNAWAELQDVARFVIEKKGRLEGFSFKQGKVGWEINVPPSVTGEEITRALGKVQTVPVGDRLKVTKGN